MFSHNPFSSSHEEKPKQDEQSLTTVLSTREDRSDLLLLLGNCTESMRATVASTFDPRAIPTAPKNQDLIDIDEEDPLQGDTTSAQDAEEKERKQLQRRTEELSSPQMQELKNAALTHFDSWREKVLSRVGEALNAHAAVEEQRKAATASTLTETATTKIGSDSKKEDAVAALARLYPPRDTPLANLDQAKRVLILHSLLLLLLSLESYNAESRILLLQITSSLHLPLSMLTDDENKVAQGLLEAAKKNMNADDETKKHAEDNAFSRKWKVGLGTVAGAALIGVTGGLAAPLLAAGIGSVMGGIGLGATAAAGYLGALAGSAPLVGALFGAYGGKMTGQMIDNYAKDVSDFAFIPVRPATAHHHSNEKDKDKDARRLRVAIGISGWLTSQKDVVQPWYVIGSSIEAFALRFELAAMTSLGNAITTYVRSYAWGWAKGEIIKRTVFASLTAALWPLGLLKLAKVVDNPFSVARVRSEKAGQVLADALIHKVQGERPVTLIGYSLGARAIYACLTALADRHAFGLVESVVLLGAPTPSDAIAWRKMRSVVSGRLVNVYSTQDYLLGFLYRTSSLQYGVAGLQAVEDVRGVENVDVSDLVDGHTKYRHLTGAILHKIGFEDIDASEVEREEQALRLEEVKEEEERKESEMEAEKKGKKAEAAHEEDHEEVNAMESKVAAKNQASGVAEVPTEKMEKTSLEGSHGKRD